MEVAAPLNPTDFNFNASSSSPIYANAPSTPRFMGSDYSHFSAPNSPAKIPDDDFYSHFDELQLSEMDDVTNRTYSLAAVPFAWEEKPGVPKSFNNNFSFHVSSDVIKPEKQQPPAAAANKERGRERNISGLSSSRSRRTRSLPPPLPAPVTAPATSTCTTLSVFGSRKWSFKDLFLFRSASDGRAMDKDPLKKYSSIFRKHDEDFRNASLRHGRTGSGSGSGSGSKRRGIRVSAHELHYTVNRAVSNDMKKQTFLPYKQGILGRLAFNPTVHALSNGFGNSHNNN